MWGCNEDETACHPSQTKNLSNLTVASCVGAVRLPVTATDGATRA